VISLDFELHWGVRDRHPADGAYTPNLLGARTVIPRLLDLFEEFEVAATWATVGFLFARSRAELESFSPQLRPVYRDRSLSPYEERVGENETDDPLHFAPGLIDRILRAPRQEMATHTFSHYYCGEAGQTADAFRSDLAAARAIAARRGVVPRSIVFPRNQHVPEYDAILIENGIRAYRGNPASRLWRFGNAEESASRWKRAGRMLDTYLGISGHGTTGWDEVLQPNGLSNVRASCFLRPHRPSLEPFEPLRLARIRRAIRFAADNGRIFHLWWHPHNLGLHQEQNLKLLRSVLVEFAACRQEHGMRSLSMLGVDSLVRPDADGRQPFSGRNGHGATSHPSGHVMS
jgi:peptidoglycan/xylan/chitin deacetylase (PgdA/CDA1 family)